jgi:hypothetical protein
VARVSGRIKNGRTTGRKKRVSTPEISVNASRQLVGAKKLIEIFEEEFEATLCSRG